MPILNAIRRRLVENQYIYRLAMTLGLAMRAKRECEIAAARGEKLIFKWSTVYWEKGDEIILFPPMRFALVDYYLTHMRAFHPRVVFKSTGGKKLADLRRPCQYRLPSGGLVWLPIPAEPLDFFTGYFAKGGPKTGQIVLDGGAYCGETTIEMATRVGPTGHVFAFEPDVKN